MGTSNICLVKFEEECGSFKGKGHRLKPEFGNGIERPNDESVEEVITEVHYPGSKNSSPVSALRSSARLCS